MSVVNDLCENEMVTLDTDLKFYIWKGAAEDIDGPNPVNVYACDYSVEGAREAVLKELGWRVHVDVISEEPLVSSSPSVWVN